MNPHYQSGTPFFQLPITMVMKATRQKSRRRLHCLECGMPIADITDKIIMAFDGETAIADYDPAHIGMVEIHCGRHACRQYYKMEFAR